MMKTDADTCDISVSLLTTSSRLSNHFLQYTPIDHPYIFVAIFVMMFVPTAIVTNYNTIY